MTDPRQILEPALTPVRAHLNRRRAHTATASGFAVGMQALPKVALGLTAAYALIWATMEPPFHPAFVPLCVLAVPVGLALASRLAARRERIGPYVAALAWDRGAHTKDRVATAVEFAADGDGSTAAARTRTLRDLAVADGVATARALDPRTATENFAPLRWSPALAVAALLVSALPMLLLLSTNVIADPAARTDSAQAGGDPRTGAMPSPVDPSADPDPPAPDPSPTPDLPDPARPEGGTEPPAAPEGPQDTPPEAPAGDAGAAASGQAAPDPRSRAAGQGKGAQRSTTTSGGGAGGGQAAGSESADPPPDTPPQPKQKKTPPPQQGGSRKGDENPSAGAPPGAGTSRGRMAAVGDERQGTDRGAERIDDPDVEEEDVDDEQEETSQRGGVTPLTRDRRKAPARELGISGDGPGGDGRGGPTPPKKSRGTAALVLGVRLPDHVRGRPNPGTAKTTTEPIPPTEIAAPARPADTVDGDPSPAMHTPVQPLGRLQPVVEAFGRLLRQPPSPGPSPDPAPK